MRRFLLFLVLIAPILEREPAAAQGISGGVAAGVPLSDTARVVTLPQIGRAPAGAHGFVAATPDGGLRFADGTPARFVGVTLEWTACTPDSAQAIVMASRLAKLGVNLVRVRYFDLSYPWGAAYSVLDADAGFLALHPERMRRFDWLVEQLRRNGIYLYLTLQSARAPVPADGFEQPVDSMLWLGVGAWQLYPQGLAALKRHARLLLDHVNPFTGRAYREEPAIALVELMERGGLLPLWRQGFTDHRAGEYTFGFAHSRRLDTLFAAFLRERHGDDSGLAAAWRVSAPPGGFPNLVREGSFEGDFQQHWEAAAYDGPTLTPILTQSDSVPDGQVALTLRVRNAGGEILKAYLRQDVELEYNTLYRLTFRARASNPAGRSIYLVGYETSEGAFSGLQSTVQITNAWGAHEAAFLTPQVMNGPVALYFFFGDVDGDISIDDVELRAVEPAGLQPGESLATATVGRVPYGNPASLLVSTRRIEDQSEFLMGLDRDLLTALRSFVKDSIGARQPITGAGHSAVSSVMDLRAQSTMDFTTVASGWDWVEARDSGVRMGNASQLRQTYAGTLYAYTALARDRQPFVATFAQPHPTRYLAESLLLLAAYAPHQGFDAVILDVWTDDRTFDTSRVIGAGEYYELAKNPVANALLPVISQIVRAGLVAPATGTIRLRHTRRQIAQIPRFYWAWGPHAAPAWIPGYAVAVNRIVHDSLDATDFTQTGDISFPPTLDGEASSDTRQIRWEWAEGVLSIDAPGLQAASGHLARSSGVSLSKLDVEVLSGTETATVAWVAIDSTRTLEDAGRSLLVVTSRTEPTGLRWRDSSEVLGWGTAPMLIDPVRARLQLDFDAPVGRLLITPLDSSGLPRGDTIALAADGSFVIDQSRTPAQWFEVVVDRGSGVATGAEARLSVAVAGQPLDGRLPLVLELPVGAGDVRLDLYDALGRHRRADALADVAPGTRRHSVAVGDLPSGAYTVVLSTAGGRATTRVTILR